MGFKEDYEKAFELLAVIPKEGMQETIEVLKEIGDFWVGKNKYVEPERKPERTGVGKIVGKSERPPLVIEDPDYEEGKNSYIDVDNFFFIVYGELVLDTELALAFLLNNDVLYANGRRYVWGKENKLEDETIVLFVDCNDIFAWGLADSESLPLKEVDSLLKMYLADIKWGAARWCIKQRKMRPQAPVEKDMRLDGSWEDEFDSFEKMGKC